jgi:hypothetical protein
MPVSLPTHTQLNPQKQQVQMRVTQLDMPVQAKANSFYMVGFVPSNGPDKDPQASLRKASRELDSRMDKAYIRNGRIVYARLCHLPTSSPFSGSGEELCWKDSAGNVAFVNNYFYRDLFVTVMVSATKQTFNKQQLDNFLASFKLL